MELEYQLDDEVGLSPREEPPESLSHTTLATIPDFSFEAPHFEALLTDQCLICHRNMMRCIVYMKDVVGDIDQQVREELHSIRRSLEEDYLRLDLWKSDCSISAGPYLTLGPIMEKHIHGAFSTINDQLSILRTEIDELKQQPAASLGTVRILNKWLFPMKDASQTITRQIHVLAEMQDSIHTTQALRFGIGPQASLQAKIDDIFKNYETSERNQFIETADTNDPSDDELRTDGSGTSVASGRSSRIAMDEQCEHCKKWFYFGALDLHRELCSTENVPSVEASAAFIHQLDQKVSHMNSPPLSRLGTPTDVGSDSFPGELREISHLSPRDRDTTSVLSTMSTQSTELKDTGMAWSRSIAPSRDTLKPRNFNFRNRPHPRRSLSFPVNLRETDRPKSVTPDGGTLPKSSYVYQNLSSDDEIRILRVFKGKHNTPIHCTLIPTTSTPFGNTHPSATTKIHLYDALSYIWGDDEARSRITMHSYADRGENSGETSPLNSTQSKFYIRSNLEAALRQLRSEDHDLDIWVDAICINQNNEKEKTTQVQNMGNIFTEARRVFVWLGAGTPENRQTFEFLEETLDLVKLDGLIASEKYREKRLLVVQLMRNQLFSRRWVIQEVALAKDAVVCWGEEMMSWSRFAEAIALFVKMDNDGFGIPKNFEPTNQGFSSPFSDFRALYASILVNTTNSLFRKSEDGKIQRRLWTLEFLVTSLLSPFEISDPRDAIYAALSLAKDTSSANPDSKARANQTTITQRKSNAVIDIFAFILSYFFALLSQFSPSPVHVETPILSDPRIAPEYNKSLLDVYTDFVDYCIENSQSLDILCRHWAPQRQRNLLRSSGYREEKMPSWIPSVRECASGLSAAALIGWVSGESFVGSVEQRNQPNYNASADLLPCVDFGKTSSLNQRRIEGTTQPSWPIPSKYDGTLYLKGFGLCEIGQLSDRVLGGLITQEALEMGGWPLKCASTTVPEQLWRTLVADRGDNGVNVPSWYHRACLDCLITLTEHNGDLNTKEILLRPSTKTAINSFLERVGRVVRNRKFFRSTDHKDNVLFGLVPPKAEINDVICIIFGCSVPVLLRECKTSNDTYFELVGECYVNGYMDGEAIDPRGRPTFPYKKAPTFKLR